MVKNSDDKPGSMVIQKITWHNGALTVTFKFNPPRSYNGIWVYSGVPKSVFEEFQAAESKGSYFNKYIRPVYNSVAVQ